MSQRAYTVANSIRQRLHTLERKLSPVGQLAFRLVEGAEVLDSWTTGAEKITAMLHAKHNLYPQSQKVEVDVYDPNGSMLLQASYDMYMDKRHAPAPLAETALAGLGTPHDLGALVEQKVQQLRQQDELERLRLERAELKDHNAELTEQVESLEAQVEAKSNLEYYSKVAGDLLPGIAKAFEKTSLGPALSGMAGQAATDDQSTVLNSTKDLVKALSEDQLSAFYMLILELQSNPAIIPAIYQNAFGHDQDH